MDKKNIARKVGDTVERVGQKISNTGATKVGDAVFNAGDKIENSNEEQSPTTNRKLNDRIL